MSARTETIRDEVRLRIATAAGDRGWNDTRQSWLSRAANRLGLTYSRTRKLWYGIGRPYADEMDEIRQRTTELKWQQQRHEERLDDYEKALSALVGTPAPQMERETQGGERARDAAASHASVRQADD